MVELPLHEGALDITDKLRALLALVNTKWMTQSPENLAEPFSNSASLAVQ